MGAGAADRRASARRSSAASPRSPAATRAGGGRSSCSASRRSVSPCSRSGSRSRPAGQFEMKDVLGEVIDDPAHADVGRGGVRPPEADQDGAHRGARASPPSASACSRRRSCRPSTSRSEFGLDSLERGVARQPRRPRASSCVLPFAARGYDARFRRGPGPGPAAGRVAAPAGRCRSCRSSTRCRTRWLFAIVGVVPTILLMTAFTMVGPVMQSVVPYRLRGMGAALGVDLHLLHRRDRRCGARGVLHRRHRPAGSGAAADGAERRSSAGC